MQNRAIEIHDSVLDRITFEERTAVLHFPSVCIHSSEGLPGIDAGSGWTQEAVLRIGDAHVEGKFSEESRDANEGNGHWLSDGNLRIDGTVTDNLIPIPLDVQCEVELSLECWGQVVRITGNSIRLDLLGSAKYIEEFDPRDG